MALASLRSLVGPVRRHCGKKMLLLKRTSILYIIRISHGRWVGVVNASKLYVAM